MADDPTNDARPPEPGGEYGTPRSTTSPYALYTTFPCAFGPRYELLGELGRGGMGVVYKARDTLLKREVALKVPTITNDRWRAQFLKEAQAAARLTEDNICRILDISDLNGQAYLSMEFVDGAPLSHRVKSAGECVPAFAPRAAAELIRTIARAMGKAHASKIVHRDLKPGNVMLARADGRPVVLDFGLAVELADDVPRETLPGTVLGTPSYMAPEQARGLRDRIGPHTDVWALGVILYELATGRRPFVGPSVMEILYKIVNEEPDAPRDVNSAIKPELEAIILRCLKKNPAERYATGTELAAALDAYLNPPLSLDDPAPADPAPAPITKRKPWPLIAGAVVLAAVAIGAVAYFTRDRGTAVVAKQFDTPAWPDDGKGPPPPVVPPGTGPDVPKPLPPMIALTRDEGTNFRAGDYEYLVDATQAGAKKWLDAQKAAKHSVMWLDAYPVGNGAKFTAHAALDGRQANWLVTLDEPIKISTEWVPSTFAESKTHTLVSLSGYPSGKQLRAALLWHPGSTLSQAHPSVIGWRVAERLPTECETVAQLRMHSHEGLAFLSVNRKKGERFTHTFGERAPGTEAYLEKARASGLRPGAVSACQLNDDTVFAATMIEDPGAMEYKFHLSLTESQLKRFVEIANDLNFVPTSLTGYETNDGTRFCTVWVRYAQKKPEPPKVSVALDPKDGTVVAVPGYEYLIDATRAGVEQWLAAHKGKHSVMWLDAFDVGGAPVFCAVAALDGRQPDWKAFLGVHTPTMLSVIPTLLDTDSHALVSLSSYNDARPADGRRTALLWHPGKRKSAVAQTGPEAKAQEFIATETKSGSAIRQIRVGRYTPDGTLLWAAHADRSVAQVVSPLLRASSEEVLKFLALNSKPGQRPGSVAATTEKNQLVFSATVIPDASVVSSVAELLLTTDELKTKAVEMAAGGYEPVSLTSYDTPSGTRRFCAVWVKYGPAKKADGPKPLVPLAPGEGTNFRAGEWEYLMDASRAGVEKWLAEQRAANHSVMWLDVYDVGDKPKFAAVAALDARQKDWRYDLDTNGGVNAAWKPAAFPNAPPAHAVVALSGYNAPKQPKAVLLWHPGPRTNAHPWIIAGNAQQQIGTGGQGACQVRIHASGGAPAGFPICSTVLTPGKSTYWYSHWAEVLETVVFIERHREPGVRPGVLSACKHPRHAGTAFGATMFSDPGAVDFKYELCATPDVLHEKSAAHASAGYVPTSLTGYDTKDGTRFCVVWVKYAPKKDEPKVSVVLDPKEGTAFRVGGYEYLIDATKDGAQKWLVAQKAAKHSVMWLDAYEVGGRGAFGALAALDDRQPKWEAFLDSAHLGYDPKRLVDTKTHTLVSLSAYYDVGVGFSKDRVASLWHPGTRQSTLRAQSDQLWVEKELPALERGDTVVRQVRPSLGMPRPQPFKETRYWSWHYYVPEEGEKGAHVWGKSEAEVTKFLAKHREPGTRPGSVSACAFDGELVYGATVFADKGATDWVAELGLKAADLKAKAGELGAKGFVPVSLTGCRTKDGVRFCAVWVKYAPP